MAEIYIHDKDMKYPNKDFVHIIDKEKVHEYVYDKDFMYRLKGAKYKALRFLYKLGLIVLIQPMCRLRYGLKIVGKKNIRQYKKLNKNGMLSICNHTTEWDFLFVSKSRYFRFPEFPAWQEGIESKQGMLYRVAGGIPMPKSSLHGMYYSYQAMKEVIKEKGWLHVFPEAACWSFYPAVRPFQIGTFKLAYEMDMPILVMAVTYRKPGGLYKLFKKHPNAALHIGKPVCINKELNKNDAIADLMNRCRLEMISLIGLKSEEENQKLIDTIPTYEVV